jgi:hypothetical protein
MDAKPQDRRHPCRWQRTGYDGLRHELHYNTMRALLASAETLPTARIGSSAVIVHSARSFATQSASKTQRFHQNLIVINTRNLQIYRNDGLKQLAAEFRQQFEWTDEDYLYDFIIFFEQQRSPFLI